MTNISKVILIIAAIFLTAVSFSAYVVKKEADNMTENTYRNIRIAEDLYASIYNIDRAEFLERSKIINSQIIAGVGYLAGYNSKLASHVFILFAGAVSTAAYLLFLRRRQTAVR
ncbi:MAG TPA: hypothetical protein VEB86_00110 [Chryseosolibacter sp.]|nr:hypothetical protein [Chryseosolibacter sp.]